MAKRRNSSFHPVGFAFSGLGDVYVADEEAGVVDRLTETGEPVDFSCGEACSAYVSDNGTGNQLTGFGHGGLLGVAASFDHTTEDIYVSRGGAVEVFDSAGEAQPSLKLTGAWKTQMKARSAPRRARAAN